MRPSFEQPIELAERPGAAPDGYWSVLKRHHGAQERHLGGQDGPLGAQMVSSWRPERVPSASRSVPETLRESARRPQNRFFNDFRRISNDFSSIFLVCPFFLSLSQCSFVCQFFLSLSQCSQFLNNSPPCAKKL